MILGEIRAVTAGAELLSDALEAEQVRVDWRPPLARLEPERAVDAANREAVGSLLAAKPTWVGVGPARDVIPGMREDLLLHSGPPLRWEQASGPMRGALEGALRLEGRVSADLEPCHHHDAVGPMAGVISPSMPVVVVEDSTSGRRAYSNLNEGLGRVLRYGANDDAVLDRLRWMNTVLGPALLPSLNLMLDVPALALSLTAVCLFLRACDRDAIGQAVLAGLVAGVAMETKYTGAVAPAVMLLAAATTRRWRLWPGAALAAAQVFVAWEFLTALLLSLIHI